MKIKKGIAVLMAVLSLAGAAAESEKVYADQIDAPYLALGADLSESEKSTVLNLLGVDASQLDQYMIVTVTNADEHAYLDAYLDASVIGSRALSSVVVEKKEEGTGIKVKTSNISYCTTGMYQNALATAGLENAEVRVAGPFNISGTAALVGAMKAYGEMTGETINPENADAATEELVITSELGESLGEQEQAEAQKNRETATVPGCLPSRRCPSRSSSPTSTADAPSTSVFPQSAGGSGAVCNTAPPHWTIAN